MKITEIISETIGEGKVYGWIDPYGQEFQTDATNDRAHHNAVLQHLKSRGIPGTEHWAEPLDPMDHYPGKEEIDYITQALADGWIRIGAMDREFVFAQFSLKVEKRPLNYLLRIILKFKPSHITIDLMSEDGHKFEGADFNNPQKAIAWIRSEVGL